MAAVEPAAATRRRRQEIAGHRQRVVDRTVGVGNRDRRLHDRPFPAKSGGQPPAVTARKIIYYLINYIIINRK